MRDSSEEERRTHNPEVAGSTPAPASKSKKSGREKKKVSNIKKVEPFVFDVFDEDKDPGDRIVIGKRRSLMKKLAKEQGVKDPKEAKIPKDDEDLVEVAMFVRRMPNERQNELNSMYKSKRVIKDAFKNERTEEYWEGDSIDKVGTEKAVWMLVNFENFVVEIGDQEAVEMYKRGFEGADKPVPTDCKVGGWVFLDGILTEEIKRHLINRFSGLRNRILTEAGKHQALEREEEERLRKNSPSG